MNNLGPHLPGACGLPAPAIRTPLGEQSWGLNESGVLEKLDEDLVDELVLGDGLDHEHPLLPEEPQHHRHFHLLQKKNKQTKRKKHKTLRWGACLESPLTPSSRKYVLAAHVQVQGKAKDSAPSRFSQPLRTWLTGTIDVLL